MLDWRTGRSSRQRVPSPSSCSGRSLLPSAALAHNFIPVIVRGEPLAKYHQKPIAANKPTALTQQVRQVPLPHPGLRALLSGLSLCTPPAPRCGVERTRCEGEPRAHVMMTLLGGVFGRPPIPPPTAS